MKRMLMMAMLCVVGVASAVTLNWTSGTATAGGSATLSPGFAKDFSVALVFNGPPSGENAALLFRVGYAADTTLDTGTGPWGAVATDGKGYQKQSAQHNTGGAGALVSGSNIVGITVAFSETRAVTYSFYVNGMLADTLRHESIGQQYYSFNALNFGANGTYYVTEGLAGASDFAALPEPTALALLALGVAGLALRRHVA